MTAWTTPKTYTSGSALTAAELNEQLRDNTLHLKESSVGTYVEGSWTPAVTYTSGAPISLAYTTQSGTYTRIGRQVFINCYLHVSTLLQAETGDLSITGLPYTVSARAVAATGFYNIPDLVTTADQFTVTFLESTTTCRLLASFHSQAWFFVGGSHMSTSSPFILNFTGSYVAA